MPKKKKGKKGKGKDKPAEMNEKTLTLVKRFQSGYKKRLELRNHTAIKAVEVGMKKGITEGKPMSQLILENENLVGEKEDSRLELLLVSVKETGYPFLRHLFIWNTPLRNMDMAVLCRHLEQRHDFTNLDLINNNLTPYAMEALGKALTVNKVVKSVCLDHNPNIGAAGLRQLTLHMPVNDTIKKLSMNYCGLGPDAGEYIGRMAAVYALSEMHFNGNQIGCTGLLELSKGLKFNQTMTLIALQDNGIDQYDTGDIDIATAIEALQEHLVENATLSKIDLDSNSIGDAGARAVLKLYAARKEAKLAAVNIRIFSRVSPELYKEVSKQTKWGKGGAKKGKKKGKGKKKKK